MDKKAALLQQWLRVNNVAIKNELSHCKDENKYRDIKVGLDVMVSVLTGENVTEGSNFYAVENLVGTDNPTINFIRNASLEELYGELTKLSDENGIKSNLSMLNHNRIIDLYEKKKAMGEITTDGLNGANQEVNNKDISYNNQNQEAKTTANYYDKSGGLNNNDVYSDVESKKDFAFSQQNTSYGNGLYENSKENSSYAQENYNSIENLSTKTHKSSYQRGIADGNDMVDMCGKSIDCKINGVRVVIIPNENGDYTIRNHESYSQSMEIKFNGGEDSQIVNKKILTREEFNEFVEKYENEIFNPDYSYEKAYIKENIESLDNPREL